MENISVITKEAMVIFENTKNIFIEKDFPYASQSFNKKCKWFNHCHKELEAIYVSQGFVTITNDRETFHLNEHEVFIACPYSNHGIVNNQQSEWLAVLFDLDMIGQVHFSGGGGGGNTLPNISLLNHLNTHSSSWPDKTRRQVISLLTQMHKEYKAKTIYWPVAIKALASQLLIIALRNFPPKEREKNGKNMQMANIKAAVEYIGGNYKKGVSLPECAAKIGYNASYFSRFFQKNMGVSFSKYVNVLKTEQAKWLLLTTTLPILDVCFESGFTDVGTFNRIFKQFVLESPSAFRKQNIR
jgi:AraC-like DNA-binding protein